MKRIMTGALALLGCLAVYAQDLPKIVPLSPNAASIAKYGEIPVGHFTGVANIGIPIYTISSGELSLPLSLSYHSGGNKVESIASWVGLGWSLGSIPSISRSVRGIPDENGGYFSLYAGYTVAELIGASDASPTNPVPQSTYDGYKTALFEGTADSEPDIFQYNILGESGKFFYNQETDTFITYPKSNIKIIRESSVFKIIDQNGNEYLFNVVETSGVGTSSPVNSTWYASKIESPSKKDEIRFTYQQESQSTKTATVSTKYHYLGGVTGNGFPTAEGSNISTNLTYAMLPDSIVFPNGYVKFNKSLSPREDLNGGKNLNNISVYNNQDQLITKYQFTYRYKQGTGSIAGTNCYNIDDFTRKWMFLDKVEQVSHDLTETLTHTFAYNESYFPDCRISAAQDYWGYYNGHDSNENLIPSYFIHNTTNQVVGADRSVNTSKSDFGILTKITYPTGGYTEFDYENNQAYSDELSPEYVKDDMGLYGDDYFDVNGNPSGLRSFESAPFTIDNPQDLVLNNNNPNGGSEVTFTIQFPGCDISGGSNPCAQFTITNITDPLNPSTNYLHLTGTSYYLPNGTYKLNASFASPNNDYKNFIFIAEWNKIAPTQNENKYVGGIRVKETRSYANATATPITKKYKYTAEFNSNTSSGDIFGTPNFNHSELIEFYKNPAQGGVSTTFLQRVRSTTNIQQVSHSGSFIGYKKVFEQTDNIDETGYTEYAYSHIKDDVSVNFPYPPPESMEIERGQLIEKTSYKKVSSGFDSIQKRSMKYSSWAFSPQLSYAIKWGTKKIRIDGFSTCRGPDCFESYKAQNLTSYVVSEGWNNLVEERVVNYYENDSIVTVTDHYYDNPAHLLKTRTEVTDSRGKRVISTIKYPEDISSPSAAVTALIHQNRIAIPIETKSYQDYDNDGTPENNELLGDQQTVFRSWFTDIIQPEFVKTAKGTLTPENRITFLSYYSENGRVKEVSKSDGTHIVYIWGYDHDLPVAKIENATFADIPTSVYNDIITASNADIDASTENTLRTRLATLRNHANLTGAMVTTFTYDPLVGVTSITDPRGQTIYYEYDGFNRLKEVTDAYGKIVSHNQYNYKN